MTGEEKLQVANMRAEGMGYMRIANALGLSVNTVRSQMHTYANAVGYSWSSQKENTGERYYNKGTVQII